MRKFFNHLFDDNNSINEKSVVGFIAFFMLVIALIVDLVTGYMGTALIINEFIFDGFMLLTLGAFGITTAGRVMSLKHKNKKQEETSEEVVD
jgi:small-conductance mechanosensitive channel